MTSFDVSIGPGCGYGCPYSHNPFFAGPVGATTITGFQSASKKVESGSLESVLQTFQETAESGHFPIDEALPLVTGFLRFSISFQISS